MQRDALVLDRADRRVDRGGDDLIGAVDVPAERDRERDEAGRGEPVVQLDREDLALRDKHRRGDGDQDRRGEAQVARRHSPVEPQTQPVRRRDDRRPDRNDHAHNLADDQAPHAEVGRRRQRDRDEERHGWLDRLERALAAVFHATEEHPQRRLQREREREVGQTHGQREQLMILIDERDERRTGQDDQRHARGQPEFQRERELEFLLLVGLVLLNVELVDPDLLERDQRQHERRDDAVEPDLGRAEQARHHETLNEHECVDQDQKAAGDERAAHRALAQFLPREREPVAHPDRTSTW